MGKKFSQSISEHLAKQNKKNIDCILCLSSGGSFEEMYASYSLSKEMKVPYHIHTVDAIPPPPWWGEKWFLNRAKRMYVRKFFAEAASFSAISKKMVEYQEVLCQRKAGALNPVIPNPVSQTFVEKENDISNEYKAVKLLYLGKLNKTRNGKELVDAIQILNKEDVIAQLDIVGLDRDKFLSNLGLDAVPENINLESWTENPEKRMANADILVDIDINNEQDVFISGKLLSYLCSNIPILSITTSKSPSAELLSSQKCGVLTARHDSEQIAKTILELSGANDYGKIAKERQVLNSKLSSKIISSRLAENIIKAAGYKY